MTSICTTNHTELSPYMFAWGQWDQKSRLRSIEDVRDKLPQLTGITLAFLTSDRYEEIKEWQKETVNQANFKITLSIGGALGEFPNAALSIDEQVIKVIQLMTEMQIKSIDFDIEGESLENEVKANNWVEFIIKLTSSYEFRNVRLTLPVEFQGGFSPGAKRLIETLQREQVRIDIYNLMIMCFNTKYRLPWGDKCCEILNEIHHYLSGICPEELCVWRKMGICPMIGVNDDKTTRIDLNDWQKLLTYAKRTDIGLVSFWAINRDQTHPFLSRDLNKYSLCQKEDFQFTKMMLEEFIYK